MRSHSVTIKGAMALAVAALLGGCMSVSSDGGMEAISAAVQTQTGLHATKIGDNAQADAARHAIDRLLASRFAGITEVPPGAPQLPPPREQPPPVNAGSWALAA